MNVFQADTYLNSFINYEKKLNKISSEDLKLERVRALLEKVGNPHLTVKCIHVAGSKGKGSTCAMVSSILKESGYKVGLYTSPHVNHYRERIRVLGKQTEETSGDIFPDCIKEEEIDSVLKKLKPHIDESSSTEPYSFYEVLTAAAFLHFAEEKVDFAVLETGLGGRLDATNVAEAVVCAITPISLEHTAILGDTLPKIAGEKAGIIKNNRQKVVIGHQEEDVYETLARRCLDLGIYPFYVRDEIRILGKEDAARMHRFDVQVRRNRLRNLKLPLWGEHQIKNAVTALGIVESLKDIGHKVSLTAIYGGLEKVIWPLRMETLEKDGMTFVLDAAHSPAAMSALVDYLKGAYPGTPVVFVLGFSKDKDIVSIYQAARSLTDRIVVTETEHPRSVDQAFMDETPGFAAGRIDVCVNMDEALEKAAEEAPSGAVIVVAGSLFAASEARKRCTN